MLCCYCVSIITFELATLAFNTFTMKPARVFFHTIVLLLLTLGVKEVFFEHEYNRCSMTYMFEHPEYQKIKFSKKVSRLYPLYELYLYGEGLYAEENKNLSLTGIPVLFLPGNAGSYRQVRSIASVALRKSENMGYKYHFDVFSVNFNEELVAFYGGSLQRQTKFVHTSIKAILRLYKNQRFPPKSITVIGHSMGGLIARALLTLNGFKHNLVNLIITQATPHVMPVLPADNYLTDFYTLVNNYWTINSNELSNVTLLSVAGGYTDYQVRSGLTFLQSSRLQNCALSVVSSAVPMTWVSTDHLSVVWCKELVLATTRALFDLIDENTTQITENPWIKMSVLKHHFLRHPAKPFESRHDTNIILPGSRKWIPVKESKWTYNVNNRSTEAFFIFPILDKRNEYDHFHCKSTDQYAYSWIFGCNETISPKCLEINDLSWETELLPTAKVITLKLEVYSNFSHFVLYLPGINGSKFSVECEFLSDDSRTTLVPVTHAFSFGFSTSHAKLNSSGLLYKIHLQNFNEIYQAFNIIIMRKCSPKEERRPSIYQVHVPWSHEDLFRLSSDEFPVKISAKLHNAQPQNESRKVRVILYASAHCIYEVAVFTSFLEILGQVVRFHGIYLPVYIVANLLLAYGAQLHSLMTQGQCADLPSSLDAAAKPYKVDPFLIICKFLLRYEWFKSSWNKMQLPQMDTIQICAFGFWFPMASLLFFIFGTSIAYWSSICLESVLRMFSSFWITWKSSPSGFPKENRIITFKVCAESVFLCLISWKTCGAFSLLLVFLRYLGKVMILYSAMRSHIPNQTCVPRSIPSKQANSKIGFPQLFDSEIRCIYGNLNLHVTTLSLNLWICLLCLPSFIYWLKNLRYSIQLDPDPHRLLAFILVFILEILMNAYRITVKSSTFLKTATLLQLPLSVIVVAFGPLHMYRVSYFIGFSLFLHVLCYLM